MAVNMTEKEYREQFQLYMLQASMEPDEEKRKEISKLISLVFLFQYYHSHLY